MADTGMFYFSSPRKTTAPPKYRASPRPKAKIGKRRRLARMDAMAQHACMARFDDPTFCASDISDFLSRYARLFPESASSPEPHDMLELSEDDKDDAGGVPLQQDDVTNPQFTSAQPPHDVADDVPALMLSPTSVLGTSHPRPHTQELWDEEDSRRLRFALDGFDTSEVPRFLEPPNVDADVEGATQGSSSTRHLQHPTSSRVQGLADSTPMAPTGDVAHVRQRDSGQQMTDQALVGSLEAHRHTLPQEPIVIIDDDRVAVDDPRRNYDFADFMDAWRLRSLSDKRFPLSFEPGIQPSIRLWRPPDVLGRKDVEPGVLDMQAIRWPMIGPTRAEASTARALLHPSRHRTAHDACSSTLSGRAQRFDAESQYRFRSFTPKHQARSPHYQLRNVVAATGRSDIFLANGSKVMRTSLACPTSQHTMMDLSKPSKCAANVRITCLAASPHGAPSDRLLLAGGFYGEYALQRLDSESSSPPHEGFVTHAYNGLVTHVHTYPGRRTTAPQAAWCSNDHKLRLMDTATLRFTHTFTYAHAVNCSATSPDARLRVLVSDCHHASITDAEKGSILVTLPGHSDHGFACAWAPNAIHVATGSEDGRTLVWDARNWSRLLRSLPSTMSCPRSLHFTDDGALVVAEDDDVVSIYDPDTFTKQQDIRFFGSIAGVALLGGGEEMVVANADRTIGGLLAFERTAQGVGKGSFGRRCLEPGRGRERRWQVPLTSRSDLLADVLV